MSKIMFVSNRLPVTITRTDDGLDFQPSIGGLATGLASVHEERESLWVGWAGLCESELSDSERTVLEQRLKDDFHSLPVYLSEEEMDKYYYGFSNRTIWPLFHYFTNYAEYDHDQWATYQAVNRKFFDQLTPILDSGDTIWVHDYQLLLLPAMIREKHPDASIGFFLHIPFPSYEIFRLLPWRKELLEGVLGADLIGFHTYDYVRHFLSSARRLCGYEHNLGYLNVGNRLAKADVFPMGINYQRYHHAYDRLATQEEAADIVKKVHGTQVVLSVDRLDYTKGIPERVKSFSQFLRDHPEYREKVTMILIVAPSRTKVDTYTDLLKEVQEQISDTNGEHGTMGWMPVWFFYRSFGFDSLTALYAISDVLLCTPLRDGMNLVAKEYIAARADKKGMLVLSETAGAASELGEAVIVNPNNIQEVADGIQKALEMTVVSKIEKNTVMHKRLENYDVTYWARDFLNKLNDVAAKQHSGGSIRLTEKRQAEMATAYKRSEKRLMMLDYDGTLREFVDKPEDAKPTAAIYTILEELAADKRNEVLLISGRDRYCLEDWFGKLDVNLVAAHGMWIRPVGEDWSVTETLTSAWKETIRPVLEVHTARTPGSLIEEKDYSLAWHYRRCEPDMAAVRVSELTDALQDMTKNLNIGLLKGNKVIEIKDTTINKGRAASIWLTRGSWEFIFVAGDDWTDEDMFAIVPPEAFSVKVGTGVSQANYRVDSVKEVHRILRKLISA
ncbi:MAG: bifunctional alpha,alpha-trehalose-phosphate synthase (UDP-forming)/trehalose-phosphatase [Lentisphaeria bacterium]|nr:bifunctional alpha,alpha-trehalose-phosphate synthase (UDP-forming)/trehalose-phosphatase [Lentisphaeria bacterium]